MLRSALLLACLNSVLLTAAEPQTRPKPLFRDFMGINGHYHFKPELYGQVCRLVRNYHNLNWDVTKPGDPITVPVCVNKVHWKNNVYGAWKAAGLETDICLQIGYEELPIPEQRALWKGQQAWSTQYGAAIAAYFGPSGAEQLCTSIEIGNEPGKRFDAATYRELFIAMATGIRQADPKVKIVTPTAHARDADDYSQDLRSAYADAEILPLYDVINLHTYAVIPRKGNTGSPWTRSFPEDPRATYVDVVDEAIAWRDRHAPGKEIWVTEFGYDACTPEAMRQREGWALKLDWQGVTDLQQAQYLVRSFFAFAQRDVDRAYIYFFNDDDKAAIHAAAGLTRKFVPKPAFWAVKQLYETLGDYRFLRVVPDQDPAIVVMEFTHGTDPTKKIWAAWSPTGAATNEKDGHVGVEVAAVLRSLPTSPTRVLGMASTDGPAQVVPFRAANDTSIALTIGESPVYILFDAP